MENLLFKTCSHFLQPICFYFTSLVTIHSFCINSLHGSSSITYECQRFYGIFLHRTKCVTLKAMYENNQNLKCKVLLPLIFTCSGKGRTEILWRKRTTRWSYSSEHWVSNVTSHIWSFERVKFFFFRLSSCFWLNRRRLLEEAAFCLWIFHWQKSPGEKIIYCFSHRFPFVAIRCLFLVTFPSSPVCFSQGNSY